MTQPALTSPDNPTPPKNNNTLIIIIVIAVVLFFGCGGGCCFAWRAGWNLFGWGVTTARNAAEKRLDELKHEAERAHHQDTTDDTADTATPPEPAKTPDRSGPSTRTPADLGLGKTKYPANFPTDLPRYPEATPWMSQVKKGGSTTSLHTKATKENTMAYYEKELTANGWTQDENADMPAGATAKYFKDGRTLQIVYIGVADSGDQGIITLDYSSKSNP